MQERTVTTWKKVFESDLSYVSNELKELVKPPAVIILDGEMGSGKTTFVKSFIGAAGKTSSPSYSIVTETGAFVHADLDRIQDQEELVHLELPLHLDQKNYFLVEWGKKHLRALVREIPEQFEYYMIKIEGPAGGASAESRNYTLIELRP